MNTSIIDPLTLPSLPLQERRSLPNCPAIYFVLEGDCVLYVGRSINLAQRWLSHHRWNELTRVYSATRIAWIECSDNELLPQLEAALIEQFTPKLNRESIENGEESVPLRLLVSEAFKNRLKGQAARMGLTMGQLIEQLADEALRELELEALKSVQKSAKSKL